MTHQLELLNICKEFRIDPIKHRKLSMLFKWRHKSVIEFLEMERPVMIIIVLSRLSKSGRTTNFMSNLIWDGSETKQDTQMATKYFNDCVDEVIDSIGKCVRKSEPVLFIKTLTTPLSLCKFLDTRLHQKRYTKITHININELDPSYLESDLKRSEILSVKYLENCSLIHQLLPLKADLSGISVLIDVDTDPVLTFSRTCDVFKEIKFKMRSGDISMLFYNSNPVINGEIISNEYKIEHHNPRQITPLNSKIFDIRIANQTKNARVFVFRLKKLVSRKQKVMDVIKNKFKLLIDKLRVRLKKLKKTENGNSHKILRPRPPDKEGKYRVSIISYVEQLDWFIFRRKFEFRVKRSESKQTHSEEVIVKELAGSWRKIWLSVYWLFLDYKDLNRYGMCKDDMINYLKTKNIKEISNCMMF